MKKTKDKILPKDENTFRVLHSADWHLGKTLNDQSREEEHQRFLTWLLNIISEHDVDALIIAGDVFDSANPPQSAQTQYYNFVSALYKQGNCSLVITAGNHDSPAQLESPKQVLQALNTHVIGHLPERLEDRLIPLPNASDPQLIVAAIPFLRDRDLRKGYAGQNAADIQQALTQGILDRYAETAEATAKWLEKGTPILATGHLTVMGSTSSESERDIHIGGLGAVQSNIFPTLFSYVALGHLHRPQSPQKHVCYSGSPIPLSFSEANDTKSLRLLDFAKGKLKAQTLMPIPTFRKLAQIRTTWDELSEALSTFDPEEHELETWVEVVVKGAGITEDLNAFIQDRVEDRNFKVLKVIREGQTSLSGFQMGDHTPTEAIETLLDDPAEVFRHRLDIETGLSKEDRQKLEIVFAQLLELQEQN